ncbi:MAG: LysM peptidoglycan-binding domain-containing protein [Chloroflexi bacterium]|nr:LysM peptidoglycan-binding domain-containing protein [Chloroflexota bacterium]
MGRQKQILVLLAILLWLGLLPQPDRVFTHHASRITFAQADPTATPNADGVIYYVVQPGDTLSAIAAYTGVPIETLLALNNLSNSDFIVAGDRLIVSIITPEATEVALTPTATRPPPTPTNTAVPAPPTLLCLTAFTDANGNGQQDPGEPLQAAVAFTVFDSTAVIANYVTDGLSEPYCVEIQTPGEYQVTRSVAPGETLTTSGNRTVIINQEDIVQLQFGGFIGPAPTAAATPQPRPIEPLPEDLPVVGSGSSAEVTVQDEPGVSQAGLIWLGVVIIVGLLLTALVVAILYLRRP